MFTLFSQYDCLVIFNGKEVTLEENESLIIEQPCKVLVYPIGKTKAFSFSIDLAKLSDSVFYKFKKVEKRFYVFLQEFSRRHSQDVYNFSISGFSCQVFIAKDSLCFLSQSQKINLELPFQIEKYSCKKMQNLIVVRLEDAKQDHLVVFNPKTNKIIFFEGHIELDEQGFWVKKEYFDSQFKIDNSGLKNVGYESKNKIPLSLLPYQFMEAVKNHTFSLAHNLLSQKLQNDISISLLKQYLPDVQYFKFVSQNQCFAISSSRCLWISFSLNDNCIDDIDIIQ